MSNHAKPSGAPKCIVKQASQQGKSALQSSFNASDFLDVGDILRATGLTDLQMASSPALRFLAGLKVCAFPKTRNQPIHLLKKAEFAAHFPNFFRPVEPQAPQNVATRQPPTTDFAGHCAPSKSLPIPISLEKPKSNIMPAKGLFKKTIGATGAAAGPDAAVATAGMKVLPKKAPAPISPKLDRALKEGAPSNFNPYVEGPYSTSKAAQIAHHLHAEKMSKRDMVEWLMDAYLDEVKRQVALNGLHGKEKLVVPDFVYENILHAVYGVEAVAQKQRRVLKIKSAVAAPVKKSVSVSPATPATPVTPVTPIMELQPVKISLQSQDSIRSVSEYSEPASVASVEKKESPREEPAAKDDSLEKAPEFIKEENIIVQEDVETALLKHIIEDDEPCSFYCGTAAGACLPSLDNLKKTLKYPYLAIRRLLRKKKASKNP